MSQSRRLAAILAADVAGYSRLIGGGRGGHPRRIGRSAANSGILRSKSITCYWSSNVVDAVRCAVEVQRQMAERNADVPPERRIEFRMGVNLGDVIRDGRDIFGDGVNIAARMEALAEPGGIDVSGMVYDQVRDKLDVAFDDLGDQRNLANARYLRSPPIPMLFLTT